MAGSIAFDPTTAKLEGAFDPSSAVKESAAVEFSKGVGRGALDVAAGIFNTPQNVWNLGKAVFGISGIPQLAAQIMGRPESEVIPSVTTPEQHVGSRISRMATEILGIRPSVTDTASQIASTGGQILGSAVASGGPFRTTGEALVNLVAPVVGGVVGEQLGGETGKIVGSIAAPMSMLGAQAGLRGLSRGVGDNAQLARENMRLFTDAGVNPTLADIAPSRAIAQNSIGRIPGASNVVNASLRKQDAQIEAAIKSAVPDINATPSVAGRTVQEGLSGWKKRFFDHYEILKNRADSLLPNNTVMEPTEYGMALVKLTTPSPGAQAQTAISISPAIKNRLDAYIKDDRSIHGMTVGGMKAVRTKLGEELSSAKWMLIADPDLGAKKLLYKALTQDLENAALQVSPQAYKAMKTANAYYAAGMERVDNFFQKLYDKADPEHVFNQLMSGGKRGSEEIRTVMKSLTPQERDVMASAAAMKLGVENPRVQNAAGTEFSFQTMLTNWAGLTKESKRALFSGTTKQSMIDDMDKIAEAAALMRGSGKIAHNPSGTAQAFTGTGAALAMMQAPLHVGGSIAAMGTAAYLMTNPKFVRWLAQSTIIPERQAQGHLTRLSSMAQSSNDKEFQNAVNDYVKAVKQQ